LAKPWIVVDVRQPAGLDRPIAERWWRTTGASIAGCIGLVGEHAADAVTDAGTVGPERVIELLAGEGVSTIVTITGRGRTLREATHRAELLAGAGALAVHIVTGDHPMALGLAGPVDFGTESVPMVAAAARLGITTSVAESPTRPGDRLGRIALKAAAGASLLILNHGGEEHNVVDFARAVTRDHATLPVVAPIPLVGDLATAHRLQSLPGLDLPAGLLAAVRTAKYPLEAALEWCAGATSVLATSRVVSGVNLSGPAVEGSMAERLAATSRFVDTVRASWISGGVR